MFVKNQIIARSLPGIVLALLLATGLPSLVLGQTCPKYESYMEKGNLLLASGKPDAALIEFQAAQIAARACGLNTDDPATALQKVFKRLQMQRDDAILAQRKAKVAQEVALIAQKRADKEATEAKIAREEDLVEKEKAEIARIEADTARAIAEWEKAKTQAALDKADKLIDAFYFYNDRFALAFKGNKYGYIDKNAEVRIRYEYDGALPFNEVTGMANVKIDNTDFLLDTSGIRYQIIRDPDYISPASEAINLNNLGLTRLSKRFSQCKGLKYLSLAGNKLRKSKSLNFELQQIVQLDLSANSFVKIPEGILSMPKLEYLNLRANHLEQASNCTKLTTLKTLDLSANRLTQLPANIGALSELQRLDISNNSLKYLPESICALSELRTLRLNFNTIRWLPDSLHLLYQLRHLEASNNNLERLPDAIGVLKNLEQLYLSSTGLDRLPESFSGLTKLRILDLSHNQLKEVPPALQYLTELREVNLAGNQITILPAWLSDLPNLQTVYLAGSELGEVPAKLKKIIVLN